MALAVTGTVTSAADPLEVTLDGDTGSVEVTLRDAGYAPAVGHRVWLIEVARFQWMIGGQIVSELTPEG